MHNKSSSAPLYFEHLEEENVFFVLIFQTNLSGNSFLCIYIVLPV